MSDVRRRAERRGRGAELLAALWLMSKRYRILAVRARTPFGEVDVVAMDGRALVLVEVKARPTQEEGLWSIGERQKERVARAGLFLARRYRLHGAPIRLDVVVVRPYAAPLHRADAWRVETLG